MMGWTGASRLTSQQHTPGPPRLKQNGASRRVMAVILLLAALALQDSPTAEEFFKRVEEKYASAKTVELKADIKAEKKNGVAGAWTLQGQFKEGNRVKIAMNGTMATDYTICCDGKSTRHGSLRSGHLHDAADRYGEGLRRLFIRAGGLVSVGSAEHPDPSKDTSASDFKFAADEKVGDRAARVLEFSVKHGTGKDSITFRVKLWVEPESLALLKRESEDNHGGKIAETYSDVKFDGEIPDETFALPTGK
jgi:outer membrane lipoprotein-sorting protein